MIVFESILVLNMSQRLEYKIGASLKRDDLQGFLTFLALDNRTSL